MSETIEYTVDKNPWRVEDFSILGKEIGVKKELLAKFHWWADNQPHLKAGWRICRMLFGIDPIIPEAVKADYYNMIYSMDEIADALKCDIQDIESELDMLKIAWEKYSKTIPVEEPKSSEKVAAANGILPAISESIPIAMDPLTEEEKNYIRARGFSLDIFEYGDYDEEQTLAEMRWFYDRLVELKKVFDEPMAKTLARQAVIKELQLRRFDETLMRQLVTSKMFRELNDDKQAMEESYQSQWKQIEEMCPYVKGSVGKVTAYGVFSDVIKGHQEFYANQSNAAIDGLLTGFEIQVELRESQQAPVRYRPGLIAAVNEAKAGLWNPNFQRTITDKQCKALDMGFQKAMDYLNEKNGVKLIDLTKDGEEGEYPPLANAADLEELDLDEGKEKSEHAEDIIVPPAEAVDLDGDTNAA